jgi:DegV family protein with EDD domain
MSLQELTAWVEENKLHLCHCVTVDDLAHLKRGGRINAATALVGTMMNIKPIIHVDDEGRLVNVGKVRGRKPATQHIADKMKELGQGYDNSTVFIAHGDCPEEAELLAKRICEIAQPKELIVVPHEPFTGAHVGPGMLALFFFGDER